LRISVNREQWGTRGRRLRPADCAFSGRAFPGRAVSAGFGKEWGNIMHIGSIVCTTHIAVPKGARGIVQRILGDMAMVTWYEGVPGQSKELNTEPFFLEDLIDTGESVLPAGAALH
jgi:hypothetical protein